MLNCIECGREMVQEMDKLQCPCGQFVMPSPYEKGAACYGPSTTIFPALKYWDEEILEHWEKREKFFADAKLLLKVYDDEKYNEVMRWILQKKNEIKAGWDRRFWPRVKRFFRKLSGRN